jgi:hypothetical protein
MMMEELSISVLAGVCYNECANVIPAKGENNA